MSDEIVEGEVPYIEDESNGLIATIEDKTKASGEISLQPEQPEGSLGIDEDLKTFIDNVMKQVEDTLKETTSLQEDIKDEIIKKIKDDLLANVNNLMPPPRTDNIGGDWKLQSRKRVRARTSKSLKRKRIARNGGRAIQKVVEVESPKLKIRISKRSSSKKRAHS